MNVSMTETGRRVSFAKQEVKELRKASRLLSFVATSVPGAMNVDVAAGVATFVARVGDDGVYEEAIGE